MQFITRLIGILIFVAVLTAAGVYAMPYLRPCGKPLAYDIGTFDSRFKISKEELLQTVVAAEKPWEAAANRELFTYKPGAAFKVNLIYDHRQEQSDEAQRLSDSIETNVQTYKQIEDRYIALSTEYKTRSNRYNERVAYWNKNGGISDAEYQELEKERVAINSLAQQVNSLASRLNELSASTNAKVDTYNTQAGRVFDKGEFTQIGHTKAISIYEFQTKPELTVALAHELGHALGLDHVENEESVMYYQLQKQDTTNMTITAEDTAELKKVCKIQS